MNDTATKPVTATLPWVDGQIDVTLLSGYMVENVYDGSVFDKTWMKDGMEESHWERLLFVMTHFRSDIDGAYAHVIAWCDQLNIWHLPADISPMLHDELARRIATALVRD